MLSKRMALLVLVAVSAVQPLHAAETRAAPLIAPNAYCTQVAKTPGITNVICDEQGRPTVISGAAPSGQLYRNELIYSRDAPPVATVNGEVVDLSLGLDPKVMAEHLKEAAARGAARRMEMCPSGEVIFAGGACTTKQSSKDVFIPAACLMLGLFCPGDFPNMSQGVIRSGIGLDDIDRLDRDAQRNLLLCIVARGQQLSDCARQYENAHLACLLTGAIGGAEAIGLCEIGMAAMNEYCTSLAPNC